MSGRGPGSSSDALLSSVRKSLPAGLGRGIDERALRSLKAAALENVSNLRQQAGQAAREGLQNAQIIASDIASSRDARQAGGKLWALLRRASNSGAARSVARALVCGYFINTVWAGLSTWQFMRQPEFQERTRRFPHAYPPADFPWFTVGVLLPAALLAALGVKVLATAAMLCVFEVWDSFVLVYTQLGAMLLYGQKPNELVLKRLAMVGCTVLVLAHSARENKAISSYAGLLLSEQRRQASVRKSLVLLLGRLLLASLFVYVGVTQVQRIIARDYILFAHVPHSAIWERDGHDNNFLLAEFSLAVPLAVGLKTGLVSRLLALTCALEALVCWPFWAAWPTFSYAAHVRLHFFTNLGVAGGLLLLASLGAGRFTVDALLEKKRA